MISSIQHGAAASRNRGYSLIELMITMGIIGVLAAIAVPAYEGYISLGKEGTAKQNCRTLAGFEDTYFYENDSYLAGEFDPSTGVDTLTVQLDWRPEGDQDKFKYRVEACGAGTIAECYKITCSFLDDPTVFEEIVKLP